MIGAFILYCQKMQYTCTAVFTAVKRDNFQLKIFFFSLKKKLKNANAFLGFEFFGKIRDRQPVKKVVMV